MRLFIGLLFGVAIGNPCLHGGVCSMRTRNNKSAFRIGRKGSPMIILWWKPSFMYFSTQYKSPNHNSSKWTSKIFQNDDPVATAGSACWKLQMNVLQAPKSAVFDIAAIAPWIASTKRTAQHRGINIDHWETIVERYESPSGISWGVLWPRNCRWETPGSISGNKDSKVALCETRCHWIYRESWVIEEKRFYHPSALPHNGHVSLQEMYLQCLSILLLVCFVIHPTNQVIRSISLLSRDNFGQFIFILFHFDVGWFWFPSV